MPVEAGTLAPDFTLKDAAEGTEHTLHDALRHSPVLLVIYKASCQASKTIVPFLEEIHLRYPPDQLTVWGVAQDSANVTRSFARRTGATFPILIDQNDYEVSRAYDIIATPTVFLIDRDGTVRWQRMGFQRASMDELAQQLSELLGTAPIAFTERANVPVWVPG